MHLRDLLASMVLGPLPVQEVDSLGLAQLVHLGAHLRATDSVGCLNVGTAAARPRTAK